MPSQSFDDVVQGPEEAIDLAQAALLLARDEYPELEVERYIARLDRLAELVRERLSADAEPTDVLLTLNEFLFEEQGFAGNIEDYYDPRNSFLNEVLDRRMGIPITLSILYIEIGRRLGLELQGVSFPGHFLVKYELSDGVVVLDPFHGGRSLSEDDLEDRIEDLLGIQAAVKTTMAELLAGAGKKQILMRMLRNLKGVYAGRDQWEKALTASNRILLVAPAEASELRDRARIYERLDCLQGALQDYQRYLALESDPEDLEAVRARVIDLQQHVGRLN
ncbi:MAG: tetratricopeptide repeat protein [Gammaproteobacteria bacterium]|nr:tetratricopeptide repeat protein [Gammaproteobacteria bacterium]